MTLMDTSLMARTDDDFYLYPVDAHQSNLPACLADTPPDLAALSQRKAFYLVLKTKDGDVVPIPGEEFERGAEAAIRAKALREELGVKVEPRQRTPKVRQQKQVRIVDGKVVGTTTTNTQTYKPRVLVVHDIDIDSVPEGFDIANDTHRALLRMWRIHSIRRPLGGDGEALLLSKFVDVIPGMQVDAIGNRYVCIGDQAPKVLWSCHTDTVHHEDGLQPIHVENGNLVLTPGSQSSCLGADCGAGIFLMLEMIEANVPGLYVFHHGEESGCIGSKWLTKNTPELVEGISYAIAFDRMGRTDVITHQMTGRCCSNAFARSLVEQLPPGYRPDDGGIYTDTAHYIGLIPECTNISVGYDSQHTSRETQDVYHLLDLRESLIAFDQDKLITPVRKVTDQDDDRWGGLGLYGGGAFYGGNRYRGHGSLYERWDDYLDGANDTNQTQTDTVSGSRGRISKDALIGEYEDEPEDWRDGLNSFSDRDDRGRSSAGVGRYRYKPRSLAFLFENYPDEAADILECWGIDVGAVWDEIVQNYGCI